MASTLIFWFVLATFTSQAAASHFRGGIITWKPDGYIPNKVIFNFRLGFRRSFSNSYFCDSSMVAQQSIVGSGGTWTASHDRGYYSRMTVADTGYHCTDFSVNEDWTQGENTFNYTFPDEGTWLVSYSSCCWISLTNGGNGNWFLSTTVNLTRRQDNGKINSSPISALSPIVRIQQGCPRIISIPREDSDGDKVRCRWSRGSSRECGGVCQGFVYSGTLDEERCTLRVHSNVALGWHAVAITLEDYPASTTNFHMATPFSHVSLQFLIHVASNSGPCNRAPVLIGQTPNGGSCEEVSGGNTFYSVIEAKHIDSSRRIAEIVTVTPLYMNVTSLLNYTDHVGDTVYYKNVSWTPKSSQKGRHIFCFKAMDEYGMESDERCITILVGSNNTPRPILSSRTPVSPTLSWPWGFGFVDFNITFDQQIKKPRHSKFIEIVLENHVIYKINTRSSSDVTIDRDGFSLRFRLPQAVLSMRGNYSVTMDRGVVVGLGCTSDGPPSPGLSSIKSWTFDVGVCSKGTFIDQSYNCNDVDECSNPLPILSRKKRNPWSWYYSSQAIYTNSPSSSDITPASSPIPAFSASLSSAVSVSGSCPYYTNQRLNGRFTSPNYPSYYRNNQRCTLLIQAPIGLYIYVRFGSFDLESRYDFLEIFDGYWAGSPRIIKASGQHTPGDIRSSGRFLFVQFSSDGSNTRRGFSASYDAVLYSFSIQPSISSSSIYSTNYFHSSPRPSNLSPTPASSAAVMPTVSAFSASISSAVSVSGSCPYYTNQQMNGRFTSPNYPSNYRNNQRCTLLIQAPTGLCIYVRFGSFDLESRWDYVEIFNGYSSGSPRIIQASGQRAPSDIRSSGRFLFVQFRSDGSVTRRGFSASYYAVSCNSSVQPKIPSTSIYSTNSISPTKSSWYIPSTNSINECSYHSYLEDTVRGMGFYNGFNGGYQCDNYLRFGWYRFRGAAGTKMPTSCVGKNRCGSHAPGWLNGTHPSVADGTVSRTVCFHWYSGCCSWSRNIRVRNCSGFYVYELGPSPACHSRYCGNGGGNYSTPNVTESFTRQLTSAILSSPSLFTSSPTSNYSTPNVTESFTQQSTSAMLSSPTFLTSSPPSSVNIQASTTGVMPIASRVPFVLHLPAQCQHNCVNTWGSYYCTCRQGYKLQADGKTCLDIDECQTQNGGCTHQCINTPGSHYCKCREGTTVGLDNKTCHEPGINVKCTDEAMFIILERKSFQGFDPSKLTLLYPSCRASYNDTHITLRTNLNDCGTTHNESEDTITFYNKVRSIEFSSGNVITRDQNVSIPFYCSYGRKAIVRNPSFKTWKNYVTSSEGGYGNFTFTMDMFKTSNYYTPYSYDDYPITVNLQDRLFIQIAVESFQSNLVVFADTCKATPSSDPYSVPQYIFLQRGCGLDSTLNYSYSISSKQRFSIQAFRFIKDHPVVHLHCEVLACHRNTARSRCLQGCSRNRGRRDEKPGSESTQVYEMSSGPIRFQKISKGKVDKRADAQMNMATTTAVGAAGGVCLLLAIALAVAVIHIKKRFKGALADRNRVYAMEQFNKYVKEENNNDGFAQDDDLNGPGEQNINMKTSA